MLEGIPLSTKIAVDAEHREKQAGAEYQAGPYPEWELYPFWFDETCDGQAGHRRAAGKPGFPFTHDFLGEFGCKLAPPGLGCVSGV